MTGIGLRVLLVTSVFVGLFCGGIPAQAVAGVAEPDPRLETSRALVAKFAGELKSALVAAMAEGGPPSAIQACRDLAPAIASRLSRESGAKLGRTSRRFRNPNNAPEPWQVAVLESFAAGAAADNDPAEYWSSGPDGRRYMQEIRTAPLCLACHGESLAPSVVELLDVEYPHDLARGYRPGELRGAFSVSWPQTKDE